MRCGHLTYDPWIWLKVTSMASPASDLNNGRISLEIPSFYSEIKNFTPFVLEAVEDRDITFNQIQGS